MQILTEAAKSIAELIGALAVIGGVVFGVFKFVESQKQQAKRQQEDSREVREELTVICYGLKACLQGLAEQGCDGPVHDALDRLDKHLNKAAHKGDAA